MLLAALMAAGCTAKPASTHPLPEAIWSLPAAPAYDYPIRNPYAATIIAVPPELKLDYSAMPAPQEKKLTVFPNRDIPEGFWYERGLRYSEMLQAKPAPLVYVIAGTGADHRAEKMRTLGNILYSAGFHVVLLPSPTHQNFIINASGNFLVGRPRQSAEDLYRVMGMIDADVTKHATVTKRMLTGYSLGALDAAFTAKLDEEKRQFNFARVLLINPPLSLYSSTKTINAMLYQGLPHGMDDADSFIKTALMRLSTTQQSGDALDFSNERALIDAYEKYQPDDAKLAATIGLSFRLSAASLAFAADVMSHAGYVFPKDKPFTTSTNLTHTMSLALRTSFIDYFNELYVQRLQAMYPGMTRAQMIEESGLESLDGYIHHNPKFGMITNLDDVILAPGEADKLARMFSPNAFVFDHGGHVGNLAYPTVGYHIVHFLRDGES
ncbi:MAG: alpha/beta hydrolase [Pseudomonadota bacterium]